MKTLYKIKEELGNNGWNWPPKDEQISNNVWHKMEQYFNDNEEVKSLMWAWFSREEIPLIGIVAITNLRTFTIEIRSDNDKANLRYVPVDNYKVDKVQFQAPKSENGFTYVQILNDTFGNGITFKTTSLAMARHFVNTLKGVISGDIEELEPSDEPILSENEKKFDSKTKPLENKIKQKPKSLNEDDKKLLDQSNWKKVSDNPKNQIVKIKKVEFNKSSKKEKINKYGSKAKSFVWLLWFLIPIFLITGSILIMYFLF
ncbi:hypothetical protein [Spiroplasma endosymbiont of Labia minor]|uniref:hypothetical protein n=1 Tax=Spiroplasma endosymbiont of Labia minor TaxID=3066305 RepID=UPI0030CD2FE0